MGLSLVQDLARFNVDAAYAAIATPSEQKVFVAESEKHRSSYRNIAGAGVERSVQDSVVMAVSE